MATLYEIDQEILDCIDTETGEIIDFERLSELQIAREEKIEKVALWYKNLVSDAAEYKAEKEVFAERERQAKAKAESLKNWLTEALNGSKMSTSKVAISFRKSEAVEIDDETEFVKWAERHRDDLLIYKAPTPNKTAIKHAIKDVATDGSLGGAHLIEKNNIQIK